MNKGVMGLVIGGLVLLGPAILKTRFGVDEVVTTLLFNFIAHLLRMRVQARGLRLWSGLGIMLAGGLARAGRI